MKRSAAIGLVDASPYLPTPFRQKKGAEKKRRKRGCSRISPENGMDFLDGAIAEGAFGRFPTESGHSD